MNDIDSIMKDCIECSAYFKLHQYDIARIDRIHRINSLNQIAVDNNKNLNINYIIPRFYVLEDKLLDYSITSNSYFITNFDPSEFLLYIDDCYFLVDPFFDKKLITDKIYQYLVLLSLNKNEYLILSTNMFFSNYFFLIYFKDNECKVYESLYINDNLNMSTILLRCNIDFSLYNKIDKLLEIFESFVFIRKL